MADNGQGSQAGRGRNPQDPARDRPNQPRQPGAPGQGAGQNNNPNPNDNNRDPNNRDNNGGNGSDGEDDIIIRDGEVLTIESDDEYFDEMVNKHYGMKRLATDYGGMTLVDDVPMTRVAGATAQEERQAKNTREASKALRDRLKDESKKFDGSDIFDMVLFIIVAEEV